MSGNFASVATVSDATGSTGFLQKFDAIHIVHTTSSTIDFTIAMSSLFGSGASGASSGTFTFHVADLQARLR